MLGQGLGTEILEFSIDGAAADEGRGVGVASKWNYRWYSCTEVRRGGVQLEGGLGRRRVPGAQP